MCAAKQQAVSIVSLLLMWGKHSNAVACVDRNNSETCFSTVHTPHMLENCQYHHEMIVMTHLFGGSVHPIQQQLHPLCGAAKITHG
jgi:mannose/fructose-specific phosphotransferase system component IIA